MLTCDASESSSRLAVQRPYRPPQAPRWLRLQLGRRPDPARRLWPPLPRGTCTAGAP
jgi:hypothetical protein